MLRHRRRQRVYTAADWPFYRPGVNPVAADTPPALVELILSHLDVLHAPASDAWWTTRCRLIEALETTHRNRYHRAGDFVVGLFDHGGRTALVIQDAFSHVSTTERRMDATLSKVRRI